MNNVISATLLLLNTSILLLPIVALGVGLYIVSSTLDVLSSFGGL